MRYIRIPRQRLFFNQGFKGFNQSVAGNQADIPENKKEEATSIPLPNETDKEPAESKESHRPLGPPFLNFFKKRFGTDEIIILGLILLLFEEKIEDEFLLIVLVYLLLS
jgi:hypothetical protein